MSSDCAQLAHLGAPFARPGFEAAQPLPHQEGQGCPEREAKANHGFRVVLASILILASSVLGCASLLALAGGGSGPGGPAGGGRGNSDPQAMIDTFREQLVVTNDAAWAAISEKNNAKLSARLAVMAGARRARGGGLLGGFGARALSPVLVVPVSLLAVPRSSRPSWRACSSADREAALRKAVGKQCARSRYPSRFGDSACRTQGQGRRPCKSAGCLARPVECPAGGSKGRAPGALSQG